jgi:ornithine carbamoyltransferase
MGQENLRQQRLAALGDYRVDASVMSLAASGAVFLHALPAYRGNEVSSEVLDGPQSLVWRQAANRVPACQAVLLHLCGFGAVADAGDVQAMHTERK